MVALTLSQKDALETQDGIALFQGQTASGRPLYVYLQVDRAGYDALEAACQSGAPIQCADYGIVIRYGMEAEPPADVKAYMEERYNFQHE